MNMYFRGYLGIILLGTLGVPGYIINRYSGRYPGIFSALEVLGYAINWYSGGSSGISGALGVPGYIPEYDQRNEV